MFKEAIWQNPITHHSIVFDEKQNVLLDKEKKQTYPIEDNGIINFLGEQRNISSKSTSPLLRRLKNGLKSDERIRQSYLSFLELWPEDIVLEVHVGNGANINCLPLKSVSFIGIDSDYETLLKAVKTRDEQQLNLTLVHGEAEHLPFVNDAFHSVFYDGDHRAWKDPKKAVLEMIRVTKPEGKILIVANPKQEKEIMGYLNEDVRDKKAQKVNKGKYVVITCYKR